MNDWSFILKKLMPSRLYVMRYASLYELLTFPTYSGKLFKYLNYLPFLKEGVLQHGF